MPEARFETIVVQPSEFQQEMVAELSERAAAVHAGAVDPSQEVAFIHTADTEAKKKELFAKVRAGQVRVLLGSTQKMGAGTNVQDRLIAVHHLDVEVARLKVLKADHQSQQYRLEDKLIKYFPAEIEMQKGFIKGFEADIATAGAHPVPEGGFAGIEINGRNYTEKAEAGEALLAACKESKSKEPVPLGSYRGFRMELSFDTFSKEFQLALEGEMTHRVSLGTSALGNLTRLDNALSAIPKRLEKADQTLEGLYAQQEAAKAELGKPFPQEAELSAKSARLAELDAMLNMDERSLGTEISEENTEEKSSVLADLKNRSEQIPPGKHSNEEVSL